MNCSQRLFLCLVLFVSTATAALAQSNLRTKTLNAEKDTVIIDTLSLIPGTVKVQCASLPDTGWFSIDYVNAQIIFYQHPAEAVHITYSVFPFSFTAKRAHKELRLIQNNQLGQPYSYQPGKNGNEDFFKSDGLTKSGSISRGLSFGNNQDVVLNSNLNVQLAGKLSDNIELTMTASDQNIPIQPEGNTQQIQEFDRVFIQARITDLPVKGRTTLTAGDFQIRDEFGYFMKYNKKLQGVGLLTETPYTGDNKFKVAGNLAVSRGKFGRNVSLENNNGNTFNGQKQERNQGPYKLRGSENEMFIVVLSGTEVIYIDGRKLERGQDADYVIDYNLAEVTFTPRNMITKDNRITVEFQYSDKNYSRTIFQSGSEFQNKKLHAYVQLYNEQDNKNKPLQQDLSDAQQNFLASIGDSLHLAGWAATDSIAFNDTEVLYEKKDSTNGSYTFQGIYIYSTDSSKAHYRLGFSNVGINKGNYRLKQSAANGKVYEWIMPDTATGQLRGSFEPVILLVTPKLKQMITAGTEWKPGKNTIIRAEGALSRYDQNTFSKFHSADDAGAAGKVFWESKIPLSSLIDSSNESKSWYLLTGADYEVIQKTFTQVERFRGVEFYRDWNLTTALPQGDQQLGKARLGLAHGNDRLIYEGSAFTETGAYDAIKHNTEANVSASGFTLNGNASLLNSKTKTWESNFLRHGAKLSKSFNLRKSKLNLGMKELNEDNRLSLPGSDSLVGGSRRFWEWEPFIELRDSLENSYRIHYKQRMDYALSPTGVQGELNLHRATLGESIGAGWDWISNPKQQLRVYGSLRRLQILDSTITTQQPENTLIGRAEYRFRLLKGFISSQTFYEVGSGLELKKEFFFLEVAAGQGTHIWNDYNNNGIKELNEFEISPFQNEANYIKIWAPTDEYISAYTNQFSEVFSLNPAVKWSNAKGLKKWMSRFSNQTAFTTDRKTTNGDAAFAYNPFLNEKVDSSLVSLNSSWRNTLSFNQADPIYGVDFSYLDIRNKTLLVNDTSLRSQLSWETRWRWNLNRVWSLGFVYRDAVKENDSRFFTTRNYLIDQQDVEPRLNIQSGAAVRWTITYKYSEKKNRLLSASGTKAQSYANNLGGEFRYSVIKKGSVSSRLNYIQNKFNEADNSPLAYEMLDGLKNGDNFTWSASYSRTLGKNIQLTLSYDGRRSPNNKSIHTGNAQVRAFF